MESYQSNYTTQNNENSCKNKNIKSVDDLIIEASERVQEFFKTCNYTVEQLNASRTMEISKSMGIPEPEKGSEIYVSNIPELVFEDELLPLFNQVGTVYRIRLMMCFSGLNKGFGYVQYVNSELAMEAIKKFNGYGIRPKKCLKVVKSIDNCRLFFGNIPKEITREVIENELGELLKNHSLTNVFVFADTSNRYHNRGFVFVEFKTHRHAALARRTFSKGLVLWGKYINVDWAVAERQVDEEKFPEVTNLFIRCIPSWVSEADINSAVKEAIPQYEKFRVRKIRDFAFIHFNSHSMAELGFKRLRDTEIKNYKMKVTWALPDEEKESSAISQNCLLDNLILPSNETKQSMKFVYNKIYKKDNNHSYDPADMSALGKYQLQNYMVRPVSQPISVVTAASNVTPAPMSVLSASPGGLTQARPQPWAAYDRPQTQNLTGNVDTMYSLARYYLEIFNFRYYEALKFFVRQIGWGEIACELFPSYDSGTLTYAAKITIHDSPMSSMINSLTAFVSFTEVAAREGAAFNTWRAIFPHMPLHTYGQMTLQY